MINIPKFEGAMREAQVTQNMLAAEMHMSDNTFTKKKKTGTFTVAQVVWLCDRLGIVEPERKCDIFLVPKFQ